MFRLAELHVYSLYELDGCEIVTCYCMHVSTVFYLLLFQVVQEFERAVIFRLGRCTPGGAKGPGIVNNTWHLECTPRGTLHDIVKSERIAGNSLR
jgi:hypothetical protein